MDQDSLSFGGFGKVEKHDPRIAEVKHWINDVYEVGRTEAISNAEIEQQMRKKLLLQVFISLVW
ncbi:hypothetical protein SDC9_179225 [bioreactor metagenome]|uniref:Uncharacterized protein n=1 Tax=bioreactor metagenome TaxID=1076179 RepID=A0A645GZB2_9ZZZZ